MNAEIGFAIIGAGYIARTHAAALAATPGARLRAICSIDGDDGRHLAAEHGIPWSSDLSGTLERKDIHAVCICTPSSLHPEQAIAAIDAGKHVLVEKPMAITLDGARAMVESAERNHRRLGVVFQRRFMPAVRYVHDAVAAGRLGRLVMGEASVAWYRTPEYYAKSSWRGTWSMDGGGALMNQAIHYTDLLLWMFGEPQTITAQSATLLHRIEVEDAITASIRFSSGALATLHATTAAFPGLYERLQICGTTGSMILEDGQLRYKFLADEDGRQVPDYGLDVQVGLGRAQSMDLGKIDLHGAQIADFVQALRKDCAPAVGGREAMRSIALVDAIYTAARCGNAVPWTDPQARSAITQLR